MKKAISFMHRSCGILQTSIRSLPRDRCGNVSLEFAIVAPIMILILLGCFQYAYVMQVEAKLQTAAQAMVELVAKQTSVDASTIKDICNAGNLMLPQSSAHLPQSHGFNDNNTLILSVTNRPGSGVQVDWQVNCLANADSTNPFLENFPFNDVVPNQNDSVVIVADYFQYVPPVHISTPSPSVMYWYSYARPYNNQTVTYQ